MKKVIFIVLFYFCQHGYYSAQFYGRKRNFGQYPRMMKLKISNPRVKRGTDEKLWSFSIPFHGTMENLNLTKTEGYLIDNQVSAWEAYGANNSKEIIYTPNQELVKKLGQMDFYHDYEKKAAVVVFHDQNRIEGLIRFYRFVLQTDYLDYDDDYEKTYILTSEQQFLERRDSGILMKEKIKRGVEEHDRLREQLPTIVYPQLLIQIAREDVRKGVMVSLRKMILYWNALDMLYSQLEKPQIRINIAGLIIPMNDLTTPWFKNKDMDENVDIHSALFGVGYHFEKYENIFPDDSFDFMFSFSEYHLQNSEGLEVSGKTFSNIGCDQEQRHNRVAILRNIIQEYPTGAHEFAHLLSAEHDEDYPLCRKFAGIMARRDQSDTPTAFQWSSCAQEAIRNYLNHAKSECLDNCPRTKSDCIYVPASKPTDAPVEIPVEVPEQVTEHITEEVPEEVTEKPHVDVPEESYCFSSFHRPAEICSNTVWALFSKKMSCENGVTCFTEHDVRKYNVPAPNGTMCEWDKSGAIAACYDGECVPINEKSPQCLLVKKNYERVTNYVSY